MTGPIKTRGFLHDVDNEKIRSLQARVWELFGFGLQYAWLLSLIFTPILSDSMGSSARIQTIRLLIIVGLACSYIVFYVFRRAIPTGRFPKKVIIGAGICGCIMTLVLTVPLESELPISVTVIAALSAGFSNAVAMLGGNRLWADHRAERAMMALAPSAFAASILCLLISFIPIIPRILLISLCPLFGHAILSQSKGGKPHAGSYRQTALNNKFFIRMSLFLFCFAFVTAAVLGLVAVKDPTQIITQSQWLLIAVIAATCIAFVLSIRRSVSGFLITISRLSVPISLIGLMLFYPLADGPVWLAMALVLCGYVLIDLFMWLLCSDLVYRTKQNSFAILARTCALQWSGLALGFIVGCNAPSFPFALINIPQSILICACAVILILGSSFIFTQHNAELFVEARTEKEGGTQRYDALIRMAESHALSKRETEVFVMVANGRSAPYIKDEFNLSESTVKTYIHNIYRKFQVDNRQGLLDVIESEPSV